MEAVPPTAWSPGVDVGEAAPVVYLLHGEDEFAIAGFTRAMEDKLGDPTSADMNVTCMPGGGLDLEELRSAAGAMPFLAPRRIVILENPSRKVNTKELREKFLALLEDLPDTTALVLAEYKSLEKSHWLLKSAAKMGERAFVREFAVPKGPQMAAWIRDYAGGLGGAVAPQAAALMAEWVGGNPRMAALEVEKALAYVDYARPVDVDDVEAVAAFAGGQGDYFALIDSIAARNGHKAIQMLKRLLEEQDPLPLFFSLVGHFRLLLQAREIVEGGGQVGAVKDTLGLHPYRAQKIAAQARTFSLAQLEAIYKRFQVQDLEIKTGQLDAELALETLVASLTN